MWVRANVYLHDLLLWLYGLHDPLQVGHTHARSTKHHQLHDRPWVQKCKSLWRPETTLVNILHMVYSMVYIMWFINMQLVFAQFYSRYVKRGYRIWIHRVLDAMFMANIRRHSGLKPTSKFEAMAMWSEDSNPMFGHIVPQMLMGICMLAVPWMLLPSWICAAVFFGVMHLSSCFCLDLRSLRIPKPIILNRRNQAHWALHEVSAFWNFSGILVWAPRFI